MTTAQDPPVRNRQKKRRTKQLAEWRAKKAAAGTPAKAAAAKPAKAAPAAKSEKSAKK